MTPETDLVTGQTYDVEFRQVEDQETLSGAEISQISVEEKHAVAFNRVEDLDYRKDGVGREVYFNVTGLDFGVPENNGGTVRNAAVTAPYMHNGAYETLEQVVDFYDCGGGAGIGIDLAHQTLPPDPLNLTEQEKADLVTFMEALTDTSSVAPPPERLPALTGDAPEGRPVTTASF